MAIATAIAPRLRRRPATRARTCRRRSEDEMVKLDVCDGCGGFVPVAAAACPHCARTVRRGLARRLGGGALGGGALAMTLMACYGAPPICPDDRSSTGDCYGSDATASDA